MSKGQLIVAEAVGGLNILGVVDLDPGLVPLVGTGETKQATALTGANAGDQLEAAVTAHIRGGENTIDGYVKFAHPIRITGTKAGMDALQELLKPKGHVKKSAHELFTIESPLQEWLELLATGDMEKVARHSFNDSLFAAIESEKYSAEDLGFPTTDPGFPVNMKIKFANKDAENLFVRAAKHHREKKSAAVGEAVNALIKAGAVQSPVADVVAAIKKDPANAVKTVTAHYLVAKKRGNMEKQAALGAILGTIGKFLLRHGGKALGGAGKLLGRGAGAGAALRRGGLAMRGAARAGGLPPKVLGGGLGIAGLAALSGGAGGADDDDQAAPNPEQLAGTYSRAPPAGGGFGPGAAAGAR